MNNWISVKDKLPEENTEVMIYVSNNWGSGMYVATLELPNYWDVWREGFKTEEGVTHWMPLPEPPKE